MLILLSLILPIQINAQSIDLSILDEIAVPLDSQELLSDKREKSFESIKNKESEAEQKLLDAYSAKRDKVNDFIIKTKIEDILKSKRFKGFIKKNTRLYHIEKNQFHYITKDIISTAFSLKDFDNFLILENKDGSISYKVHFKDITPINKLSQMYEKPERFDLITEDRIKKSAYNRNLDLKGAFRLKLGFMSPTFSSDLIEESFLARYSGYEYNSYAVLPLPIDAGLGVEFEDTSAIITNGRYTSNTLFAQAFIRSKEFSLFFIQNLTSVFKAKQSLYSEINMIKNQTNNFQISRSALEFEIDKRVESIWGQFHIGLMIQRQWARATKVDKEFNALIDTRNNYDDLISFNIGFNHNWGSL